MIAAYRRAVLLELAVQELHVVATHDDLMLERRRVATIPLPAPAPPGAAP